GAATEHARALLTYFQIIADRSPLPVVLYSASSVEGGLLPVEVVIELAGHPQIIGLVDSAGGRERIEAQREVRARAKREGTLAAWKDGDEGLAQEKQVRLQSVAESVEEELGVAGIKFGCDLNGYFGGRPRLPLLPLNGEERAKVEALMQGLRN